MSTRTKATLMTIGLAGAAFILGPVIWSPAPDFPTPSSAQLPFFVVLAGVEALLFGLGVSFLLFGWPLARRAARRTRATVALVCIFWLVVSWWPHIGLHLRLGFDMWALLLIDYAFHLTLMAAGVILVYLFVTDVRAGKAVTASAASVQQPPPDRPEAASAR
jgi:hypothetical protein